MEKQPILEVPLSPNDKILDGLGWLALIGTWILLLTNFQSLPETIPSHFDFRGNPDGYSSRNTILVLPIVGTVAFFFLTWINRKPHQFNYPVKITPENAFRQYSNATKLIRFLKLALLLLFLGLLYQTIQTGLGQSSGLGKWFLPAALVMMFAPLMVFLKKAYAK